MPSETERIIEEAFERAEKAHEKRIEELNKLDYRGESVFESIYDSLLIYLNTIKALEELNKRYGP